VQHVHAPARWPLTCSSIGPVRTVVPSPQSKHRHHRPSCPASRARQSDRRAATALLLVTRRSSFAGSPADVPHIALRSAEGRTDRGAGASRGRGGVRGTACGVSVRVT
jgi:hypothetical protein